jgi:hypothetical protein
MFLRLFFFYLFLVLIFVLDTEPYQTFQQPLTYTKLQRPKAISPFDPILNTVLVRYALFMHY